MSMSIPVIAIDPLAGQRLGFLVGVANRTDEGIVVYPVLQLPVISVKTRSGFQCLYSGEPDKTPDWANGINAAICYLAKDGEAYKGWQKANDLAFRALVEMSAREPIPTQNFSLPIWQPAMVDMGGDDFQIYVTHEGRDLGDLWQQWRDQEHYIQSLRVESAINRGKTNALDAIG